MLQLQDNDAVHMLQVQDNDAVPMPLSLQSHCDVTALAAATETMTATYAVLVCLSSTDAATVIRLEAQARILTCHFHTNRSPKGRPASWSREAASTTLLTALRGHMPRLHDMPVALRLKPQLSREAALCQCLLRLSPRGPRQGS